MKTHLILVQPHGSNAFTVQVKAHSATEALCIVRALFGAAVKAAPSSPPYKDRGKTVQHALVLNKCMGKKPRKQPDDRAADDDALGSAR